MSFSQQPSEHQPVRPVAPETLSAEENEWEEELADARRRLAAVVDTLETEDDTPVDNLFSAKQQRLLTRTLYSSWTPPPTDTAPAARRSFLADANVGLFFLPHQPLLVPDFFLSLDVRPHDNWYAKEHRSYFFWVFGKAPVVVVEIVSNRKGGELSDKLQRYAEIDVTYYVVYDPVQLLSPDVLRVYEREAGRRRYHLRDNLRSPGVGLSVKVWEGVFEDHRDTWLRWYDHEDRLILTGQERAVLAEDRAAQAEDRAAQAEDRAARLAAQLRELGIEPDPSS